MKLRLPYIFMIGIIMLLFCAIATDIYQVIRIKNQFTPEDYRLFKNAVVFNYRGMDMLRILNSDSYYTGYYHRDGRRRYWFTDSVDNIEVKSIPDIYWKRYKSLDVYAVGNYPTFKDTTILQVYVTPRLIVNFKYDTPTLSSNVDWYWDAFYFHLPMFGRRIEREDSTYIY